MNVRSFLLVALSLVASLSSVACGGAEDDADESGSAISGKPSSAPIDPAEAAAAVQRGQTEQFRRVTRATLLSEYARASNASLSALERFRFSCYAKNEKTKGFRWEVTPVAASGKGENPLHLALGRYASVSDIVVLEDGQPDGTATVTFIAPGFIEPNSTGLCDDNSQAGLTLATCTKVGDSGPTASQCTFE